MIKKGMSIKELQEHVMLIDHNPERKLEVMLKLVEEVGELAIEIRKESTYGLTTEIYNNIKYEMYDVVHYINHLANIYDIDLEKAILEKDKINQVRYGRNEENND